MPIGLRAKFRGFRIILEMDFRFLRRLAGNGSVWKATLDWSRSDPMTVAVAFKPRNEYRNGIRRVATVESPGPTPSSVAPRRGRLVQSVRGINPTATVKARSASKRTHYPGSV